MRNPYPKKEKRFIVSQEALVTYLILLFAFLALFIIFLVRYSILSNTNFRPNYINCMHGVKMEYLDSIDPHLTVLVDAWGETYLTYTEPSTKEQSTVKMLLPNGSVRSVRNDMENIALTLSIVDGVPKIRDENGIIYQLSMSRERSQSILLPDGKNYNMPVI